MNDILTTLEMDGLLTKQDIANRFLAMRQCRRCNNWTKQDLRHKDNEPCTNCSSTDFDPTSSKSIRTYNFLTDKKRKVK